jgi:outer membrane protein assembly factor BamB
VIADLAGKRQMVMSGSKSVASYDPDSGKQHWVIDGPTEQFVASVVHTQGVVFVTGGFPDLHILGIDPSGAGNVTQSHVKWRGPDRRSVSYVPSPVAHGDWFFAISDGGLATCFEAKSGRVMWKEKLGRHHSASAVASADGKLYFTSDAGETFVIKAGPKYELVSKNELGEECYASPAISDGQIFLRGVDHLYCIKR